MSQSDQTGRPFTLAAVTGRLQPQPVVKQLFRWQQDGWDISDALDYWEHQLPDLTLPEAADGFFALPTLAALIRKFCPHLHQPDKQYHVVLQMILNSLRQAWSFRVDGELLSPSLLRRNEATVEALALIGARQRGDIMIIPAQLGWHYRGWSVTDVHSQLAKQEFGLGALEVGLILLTHRDWLSPYSSEMNIYCPGDAYRDTHKTDFNQVVVWQWAAQVLRLSSSAPDNAGDNFGPATAFVLGE